MGLIGLRHVREAVKKPVKIKFLQWTGENHRDICDFVGRELDINSNGTGKPEELIIPTLEGDHLAILGDYIIQGVEGEFYPCKPSIFQKTYDIEE